jgi:hypothetical protein
MPPRANRGRAAARRLPAPVLGGRLRGGLVHLVRHKHAQSNQNHKAPSTKQSNHKAPSTLGNQCKKNLNNFLHQFFFFYKLVKTIEFTL